MFSLIAIKLSTIICPAAATAWTAIMGALLEEWPRSSVQDASISVKDPYRIVSSTEITEYTWESSLVRRK